MPGRLNAIDLDSDLYFLILYHADGGVYRSDLHDAISAVDTSPFPFDIDPEDYSSFMDTLRMLEELGAIPTLRERKRIELTEKGEKIAEPLLDIPDDDQLAAIESAMNEADIDH